MAVYTYKCDAGHTFELRQRIGDEPIRQCTICQAGVRRVVSPVGIVFKGSGFYVTDNRNGKANSASTSSAKAKSETTSGGENKESGATTGAPATPSASAD
jgi:putative FmdB family regulatory protein